MFLFQNSFAMTPSSMSLPTPETPESVTLCDVQHGASRTNFEDLTIEEENDLHTSESDFGESVVTSHGKKCLWCGRESTTETPRGAFQQQVTGYDRDIIEDPDGVHNDRSDQLKSPDLGGLPADMIPPILYRWYDCDSQGINSEDGLVAGLFRVSDFVSPGKVSNLEFETYFRNHVSKKKTLSPFISFFRSPLAPIHRAMQSQQPQTATLVVIDTTRLETKVFSAHQLAEHYVGTFTYSWRGWGEFEVWGRVPAQAIVFTSKISTIVNLALASSNRDINRLLQLSVIRDSLRCNKALRDKLAAKRKSPYKSGRTFGKFLTLLKFPFLHWEHAADWFMPCWGWVSKEEMVKFKSGLRSETPYSNEELSDSESEGYLITPLATPKKKPVSQLQQRSLTPSDMDYEPSDTLRSSAVSTDDEVDDESENASGIMEERTETIDDDHFSTHESLSSFGFQYENPPVSRMELLALSPENQDQSGSLPNYEMCLGDFSVVVSSHFQDKTHASPAFEEDTGDCLILEGGLWKTL